MLRDGVHLLLRSPPVPILRGGHPREPPPPRTDYDRSPAKRQENISRQRGVVAPVIRMRQ
eukprot:692629-Pyramimonas_sp.AAC.1